MYYFIDNYKINAKEKWLHKELDLNIDFAQYQISNLNLNTFLKY